MKNKKGYSLLELILVLGIIAALIVAAFIIYPKVSSSMRVNKELKNISFVIDGLANIYKGRTDLKDVSTIVAINAKLVPDDMLIPGNTAYFKNVWGGMVNIGANSSTTGSTTYWDTIELYEYSIPSSDCAKFVKAFYDEFALRQTALKVMTVNSTNLFFNVGSSSTTPTVNFEDIVKACNEQETSSLNMRIAL